MQPVIANKASGQTEPAAVMQRREMKYVLTRDQTERLKERLKERLETDPHGRATVASLYYDTPDGRLIRASLDRPRFKEKIRLRAYGPVDDDSPVYVELKRKVNGVVYKRRAETTIRTAKHFFARECDVCADGQIGREIRAFRDRYETLEPACLIAYERTAFIEANGDLRVTVDEAPRYRTQRLELTAPPDGVLLLPDGDSILEIKARDALPLWLARMLSEEQIYKRSFSKYGEAYRQRLARASAERTAEYV